MIHNTLANYLETVDTLQQRHQYSRREIEDMIPWERDMFVDRLILWLKEKEKTNAGI